MLRTLAGLLALPYLAVSGWRLHAGEVDDRLASGIKNFRAKDYAGATQNFEGAARLRPADAHLAHDVALSALKLGEKPKATAYWRRALALDPAYRPARLGRDYAETKMGARPFESGAVDLALRRAFERLPLALLAALTALFLALAAERWSKVIRARIESRLAAGDPPPFGARAILASLAFVASGAATAYKFTFTQTTYATVLGPETAARSAPADDALNLFSLMGGAEVRVRAERGGWLQVENPEGNTGWVKAGEALIE